jgi:NADPH:quinone reductase-like Zn-dependent oxidoreductase
VLAAGLHPRVRSQADGSHYTSTDELPLVPGIDAVVRDPRGRIRYAILDDTTLGTMAERTLIDLRRSVVLPSGIDPVRIAAAMNPAMSSWVALRRRVDFPRRQSVLVLGATGSAGRMAIQIAGAPLTWIQIGSVAGPTAPIPSAAATTRDRLVIVP